jgi:hypothetical protein
MNSRQTWVFRLAHNGKQLKPAIVISALDEIADGPGHEIWWWQCAGGRTLSYRCSDGRIERRQHRGGNVWAVQTVDEVTQHDRPSFELQPIYQLRRRDHILS